MPNTAIRLSAMLACIRIIPYSKICTNLCVDIKKIFKILIYCNQPQLNPILGSIDLELPFKMVNS